MEKGSTVIEAGAVDFAMSYRKEIMDDQGLCVQVYADVAGKDTEILRFDCFDQGPTTIMVRKIITLDYSWIKLQWVEVP